MKDNKEIEPFEQDTKNVIENTLTALIQGITGIATSSKKDVILSLSHMFQKMRGGHFLSILLEEWNRYMEKGKVKENYQFTEQHKACLQELLEFLDKDSPDEVRFTVLKKIFLVAASEQESDRDSFLPQEFMKIARSLSSGEVILLKSNWEIAKKGEHKTEALASEWITKMKEASGMRHKELVLIHEEGLVNKKLLTSRGLEDHTNMPFDPQHYRLTELGFELCSFIEKYES